MGYRIFVVPGIILHELSHALFCFLTGAKITKISFFDKNGGEVKHSPSKLPVIGQILISCAPFVFGAVAIYFLSRKLGVESFNLDSMEITKEGIKNYVVESIKSIDFKNIQTLVVLYMVTTIAVTMTPSSQDLRNIFLSIIVLGIASYFVIQSHLINIDNITVPSYAFTLFSTVVFLLIFALIPSIILFILSKALRPNS